MKSVNLLIAVGALVTAGMAVTAEAGVVTGGNLMVFQAGDGSTLSNNSVFSILELTKGAGQVSPIQTFNISGSASPLYTSATATSTGYLSLSENRGSLQFDAHTIRAAIGTNENTITARGVGSIAASGTYSIIGTYTGSNGQQARSAGLMTSGDLFIGDQAGIYAPSATSPTVTNNTRNIHVFGGTAFMAQASSTAAAVSSISGTPAALTLTALPSLPAISTLQDFYMVSSANNSVFDLLYVATTSGVSKFQLSGGAWAARGTATISGGLFGLAAELDASGGIDLYVTTGGGATNGNSVKRFIDSAAPSANITLDAGTTLFTASNNYTIKGIELAPIPTPGTCGLLAMGGLLAARRRR